MISAQVRGGKAGVLEFVSTARGYVLPVLTSLAAFSANLGVSRFAAPISSSGPHFDLHQPGASSARDSNEARPVPTALLLEGGVGISGRGPPGRKHGEAGGHRGGRAEHPRAGPRPAPPSGQK